MPETREQVRPLAPASGRPTTSNEEEADATTVTYTRGRRCLRCCAYCCPGLLLQIVVMVILMFTVFKPKNPVFRVNGITVDKLELINGTGTTRPRPGSNMSLTVDVSVKNPNYVSFRYLHTATGLFYRGTEIGAARVPPGFSKARRTMRLNVTVDVILDRLLSQPDLRSDLNSSLITIVSYTKVSGRVKMLIVKMHVKAKLNCTVAFNITSQAIHRQKCKHKFKL